MAYCKKCKAPVDEGEKFCPRCGGAMVQAQNAETQGDAMADNALLKERLDILYEYEKKYLDLTKTYKEEIKFAETLQADIRKERSKFFAENLKDVHKTLSELNVDSQVVGSWIVELVNSYTKSLDISADLAKDHILQMLGLLKEASKQEAAKERAALSPPPPEAQ